MRSFEAVTGPKTDRWLVKTVGVLIGIIGGVLVISGRGRRVPLEPTVLATASAAGLAAIDTIYASRGRISKIYLLDAAGELALLGAWALGKRRQAGRRLPRRRAPRRRAA
jgi:hypothetical protein